MHFDILSGGQVRLTCPIGYSNFGSNFNLVNPTFHDVDFKQKLCIQKLD